MSFPNYGLLPANINWAYFVFLGDLSSSLSLAVGFSGTFGFLLILGPFLSGPRGTHLMTL